jgi:hypothetical protein
MADSVGYSNSKKEFLLGMGLFFAGFLISYVFVTFIMPIPYNAAGIYAFFCFLAGVMASILLIFAKYSLVGLGGSLATILYVVIFAVTWPFVR